MEDLFTPPVATRVHVYPNIAAYEVLCKKNKNMTSLAGQLKQFTEIPDATVTVDYSLSACVAFTTVAKKLVYSEFLINDFENSECTAWLKINNKDSALLKASIAYGRLAGQQVITYLLKDNYGYTRTLERYVLSDSLGAWQPTGPNYANALEPNWPIIRSMVFDSTNRIKSIPKCAYSEDKNSECYKLAMEVYNQSQHLDSTKKLIASFWDCNPNILRASGHFTYFEHRISPAGHWIGIACEAVKNLNLDEYKTAQVFTLTTLAEFEAILFCWTEKYAYNSIRPETYINRLIAPTWTPFIETPPFPEYTSGHSSISGAASTVLMLLIPQPYSFTDSTEMYIDLPARTFNSFKEAADEASISRFYGGIHFMPALNNGLKQGRELGSYLVAHLKTL
ncbi:hypothetical protein LBMAG27_20980 [Bacteroidota bacterium]|nr:hypothetical protein LBMAG27_20980 [Bacteroidota bacterium]